jgi:hypothetical protein
MAFFRKAPPEAQHDRGVKAALAVILLSIPGAPQWELAGKLWGASRDPPPNAVVEAFIRALRFFPEETARTVIANLPIRTVGIRHAMAVPYLNLIERLLEICGEATTLPMSVMRRCFRGADRVRSASVHSSTSLSSIEQRFEALHSRAAQKEREATHRKIVVSSNPFA